jgi:hypothetical protein
VNRAANCIPEMLADSGLIPFVNRYTGIIVIAASMTYAFFSYFSLKLIFAES